MFFGKKDSQIKERLIENNDDQSLPDDEQLEGGDKPKLSKMTSSIRVGDDGELIGLKQLKNQLKQDQKHIF
jgi:hypothetical protein